MGFIEKKMLRSAYKSGARIFNINVGSKKRTVIFKAVDYHPVTDEVIHVDLYGVRMDQSVNVFVVVNLIGSALGLKEGGILVQGQNEIEIECLPMDIPEYIEVDVSELAIGDVRRVANLTINDKISIKTSSDQILASVTHQMKEETVVEDIEETDEDFIDESEDKDSTNISDDKDHESN